MASAALDTTRLIFLHSVKIGSLGGTVWHDVASQEEMTGKAEASSWRQKISYVGVYIQDHIASMVADGSSGMGGEIVQEMMSFGQSLCGRLGLSK